MNKSSSSFLQPINTLFFFFSFCPFLPFYNIMRILSIYTPILKTSCYAKSAVVFSISSKSSRFYHSADYSGGGLMGRGDFSNMSTPPSSSHASSSSSRGPEDPFAHLDLGQIADPRSVSACVYLFVYVRIKFYMQLDCTTS